MRVGDQFAQRLDRGWIAEGCAEGRRFRARFFVAAGQDLCVSRFPIGWRRHVSLTLQRLADVFHDCDLLVRVVRIGERLDERGECGRECRRSLRAAA